MTPRQREFCRHYLGGLSAPRAARAAGYAASTAEKNAATILSSERVARHLDRQRKAAQLVTIDHLQEVRDAMLSVLKEPDAKAKAMAGHALVRLFTLCPQLAARQDAPDDFPADPQPELLQNTTQNAPQLPDRQQKRAAKKPNQKRVQKAPETIGETDAFPSGEPAFDRRLSPIKAEIARPKTPVTVIFRSFTKPKRKPVAAARRRARSSPKPTPE